MIDHPLVKIENIERVKFLHNEIQARKYVITTLIEKYLKFIIFSSKQMVLLFTNFRTSRWRSTDDLFELHRFN
jgi:hypothetical protein